MKRVPILLCFLSLLAASLLWLSCGGSKSSGPHTSGVKYRAFITNSVGNGAGVYIVNAATDVRPFVGPIAAGTAPGMMAVAPNLTQTLVFSPGSDPIFPQNQFTIISNAGETDAAQVPLPGMTYSFVVSPDSSTAYVAVPAAPVVGQSPGVVEVINLGLGAITSSISCPPGNPSPAVCVAAPQPASPNCVLYPDECPGFNPAYHFLAIGNTGNRVLAFSEGADSVANTVAVITPSSVGTANPVVTFVDGVFFDPVTFKYTFDRPIWAYFNSDDTTAYVLNCGPECGGKQASIQPLDLTKNPPTPGAPVPIPNGATVALVVNSSTMYVAGTPYSGGVPSQACTGQTTAATTCGVLTIVDLNPPITVTSAAPIITDGYHTRLALGPNGQLFIGASACTEISTATETRGCLSIYNTLGGAVGSAPAGGVLIPPANGDVTGIQPIADRGSGVAQYVTYVIQGGSLNIYDDTIDALEYNPSDPNNPGQINGLVGDFIDVKTVDF